MNYEKPDTSATPTKLFKYVSAERALQCITEKGRGALRATQPCALNDPFEFNFVKAFVDDDDTRRDKNLSSILTGLYPSTPISVDDVSAARGEFGSMAERELFLMQISQRYGIVSFAEDPMNPLMWAHYTSDASGFVIGYEVEPLKEAVASVEGVLAPVEYQKHLTPILDNNVITDENILVLLTKKSCHWGYEKEWRLIVRLKKTVDTGRTDEKGCSVCLFEIPNTCVTEIYYTERTPLDAVESIQKRLGDAGNRYRVQSMRKLILSDKEYAYQMEQR